MSAAADLRRELSGKQAAAALPMEVCQTHQVEGHQSAKHTDLARLQQLVESVTCQSAAHLQCAAWPAESPEQGAPPQKTNIISVPQTWTDKLCQEIAGVGWSCQAIDGVPLALARAVAMGLPRNNTATYAALDWGYSQATFCVVQTSRHWASWRAFSSPRCFSQRFSYWWISSRASSSQPPSFSQPS